MGSARGHLDANIGLVQHGGAFHLCFDNCGAAEDRRGTYDVMLRQLSDRCGIMEAVAITIDPNALRLPRGGRGEQVEVAHGALGLPGHRWWLGGSIRLRL